MKIDLVEVREAVVLIVTAPYWLVRFHLESYRWWRRWRGGTWFQVAPWPALPYIDPFWTRYALPIERVFAREDWPCGGTPSSV